MKPNRALSYFTALMLASTSHVMAGSLPLVQNGAQTQQLPANTTLNTRGASTGNASINMPHGSAPSSPNNGDCWTTTAGLFCYINGTPVGPYATSSGGGVTSVATGCGLTGGTITTSGTISAVATNVADATTTRAFGSTDACKTIIRSNASAMTDTLPQAGTSSMNAGFQMAVMNYGAGTETITPGGGSFIGGKSALVLTSGESCDISVNAGATAYDTSECKAQPSGVTAGTYGDATHCSYITVDAAGIITNATNNTSCPGGGGGGGSPVPGTMQGLNPTWVSTTQLGASGGTVYIEGSAANFNCNPSNITPSSPAANTWYHIYINASCNLSASTTVPTPFATSTGTAESKTGDTANRYVYSALTDASNHFYQFVYQAPAGVMRWIGPVTAAPFNVLAGGTSTSPVAIDASPVAPITATSVLLGALNLAPAANLYLGPNGITLSGSNLNAYLYQLSGQEILIPTDNAQKFQYMYSGTATTGAYIDVDGWTLSR
jgi:hypothetical protein